MPAVTGWQSALDQELATAGNSSEPGSRIYRDGLVDMKAAKYPNAVAKFQAFQRAHPKSPLAEPAEYFSANALFELGARDPSNYNQSILQFNDLAMRYPQGPLRRQRAIARGAGVLAHQRLARCAPHAAEAGPRPSGHARGGGRRRDDEKHGEQLTASESRPCSR